MTSQGENGEDRPIVRGESETETRITCSSLHPKKKKKKKMRERLELLVHHCIKILGHHSNSIKTHTKYI